MVTQDQRRKQLAREKFLRQEERRKVTRRKSLLRNGVVASVLALVLVGAGVSFVLGSLRDDDPAKAQDPAESLESPSPSKAADPCEKPAEGKPAGQRYEKEPPMTIDTAADWTMKLATTCGDIEIAMDTEAAPHTVNSFAFLASKKYFDHTNCHRLTSSLLQCGSPDGSPSGTPGYKIPDENLKSKKVAGGVYPAGTVAMANTYNAQTGEGRDTGGSQFFLVFEDTPLPADYTPFGQVSAEGMKVLKKISAAGESTGMGDGAPNATVVIDKATVTKS